MSCYYKYSFIENIDFKVIDNKNILNCNSYTNL